MPGDEVYVVDHVDGEPVTYHLFKTCPSITSSIHGAEACDRDDADDLEQCDLCADRRKRNRENHPRKGLARELLEADPDDVGEEDPPLVTDGGYQVKNPDMAAHLIETVINNSEAALTDDEIERLRAAQDWVLGLPGGGDDGE